MEEKGNIRIKDIAKLAGVSVGTVDRVIHKRGKVSALAQQKVEEVLKQTAYQPNLIARTLGSNKKIKIAVLIPDPDQDEYWALSNAGISLAVQEWSPYNIEITSCHFDLYDSSSFRQTAGNMLTERPDGLLIAPIFHRESLKLFEQINEAEIPYIFFNSNVPEASPTCFIGQNLYQSGRVAGELMDIDHKGNRTFAVLHIYEDIENSVHLKAKENGLRDYFKEYGNNSCEIISMGLSSPKKAGFEKQVLEMLKKNDPQGLLVTTSKGTHIIASILEKHWHKKILLVGYDLLEQNINYLKKGIIDFLINQNPTRQTQLGIGYLVNSLLFKKAPPEKNLFPLEIIIRQNLESYIDSNIH